MRRGCTHDDASNFDPIADSSMLDGAICNDDCFNFLRAEAIPDVENKGSPDPASRKTTRKSVTFRTDDDSQASHSGLSSSRSSSCNGVSSHG